MSRLAGGEAERLYSLDAARAVAALAVVFQHWEIFFSLQRFSAATEASPLYWLFHPFYEKGARAVTFFFCLSGFIFYWLYSRKVHEKVVGPATFAVLRLSRLYPLHLLTLLLCLALQWPLIGMLGHPFTYPEHDAYHFGLNLFLVQYWGFERGYSFNGPSWSISVEIFLYIAFFFVCRLVRPSLWQCLALALVAMVLARFSVLAAAAQTFFMGGAFFFIYRMLASRWTARRHFALVVLVIASWALIPMLTRPDVLESLRGLPGGGVVAAGLGVLAERQYEFVLFPLTVLALALSEVAWKRIPWRWLHDLGNMSFGIYLLHFPLELAFVWAALSFAFPADFFTRTTTLLLFMGILLALAAVSYRAFEKPAMDVLRAAWKQRRFGSRHQVAAKTTSRPAGS